MKSYVGVNNLAKEIKKAYIGYNNQSIIIPITASDGDTRIFGAEWSGNSETTWVRTDDAADFPNPNPYYAGMSGTPSSPFDDIMPWSGMVRSIDSAAGEVVAIPKFYYKLGYKTGTTGMKIQISMIQHDGFLCSPAHMDRGDGAGERDVVYVGRYHCVSGYKSTTGSAPLASITRATARSGIHNLGSKIWQWDYATLVTIWLLYLVEFANWNSQTCIGYGCSDSDSKQNNGLTDSMTYHTGTTKSNRTTYGHMQYRHIEDLWGNVLDWCDGIYFNGTNIYCIKNPSNFSDSANGVNVGTRPTSSRFITAWNVPSTEGYEYAIYPTIVSGSDSTYICDYCDYASGAVVLCVGGYYTQVLYHGLFCLVGYYGASSSNVSIGSRLMILP